jgi:hypothetical protein
MMTRISIVAAGLLLAACTPPENAPMFFGQINTVGVSVSGGPTGTTPDLTVGVKNADLAVVPTYDASGQPIQAVLANGGERDALSTFGSFDSNTQPGSVSIGTFFATGFPGQRIAKGLGCAAAIKAANGNAAACETLKI